MDLSNTSIIYFIYVSFCVWRQLCHSINASYINDNKYDVIIVGCGVSGLKAAEILHEHNRRLKILILEAQNHIGGRVHTIFDNNLNESINLGASYIHGSSFNSNNDMDNERYAINPLLHYFSKDMLYQMQFLPPLDSTLSERDIDNAKSNNQIKEKFIINIMQKNKGIVSYETYINAYRKYCRVLKLSALEALKILKNNRKKADFASFHNNYDDDDAGGGEDTKVKRSKDDLTNTKVDLLNKFNLMYFFNKTLRNMSKKEKWNKDTFELVFHMSEFAIDDIGVSLQESHPYFWDTEGNVFPGYDSQIKNLKYKMNLLIHQLLEKMDFNINNIVNRDDMNDFKFQNNNGNVVILLSSKVNKIIYNNSSSPVIAQTLTETCTRLLADDNYVGINCIKSFQNYTASTGIILTVSTGVLNEATVNTNIGSGGNNSENIITFYPKLPRKLVNAFSTRQMGETVKIFLKFSRLFWTKGIHLYTMEDNNNSPFKLIWNEYQDYSSMKDKMYYLCLTSTGVDAIQQIKLLDEKHIIELAMQTIVNIFTNIVPTRTNARHIVYESFAGHHIAWWTHDSNPYVRGSWSSWRPNCTLAHISLLANINYILPNTKLYFAGESFSRHYHGTLHGALLSGEQTAIDLLSDRMEDLYDMKLSYNYMKKKDNVTINHGKFPFDMVDDQNCAELLKYMHLMVLKKEIHIVELIDPPMISRTNHVSQQDSITEIKVRKENREECALAYSTFLNEIGKTLNLYGFNIGNGDIDDNEMITIVNKLQGRPLLYLHLLNVSSNDIGDVGLHYLIEHLITSSIDQQKKIEISELATNSIDLHIHAFDNYFSKKAVEKVRRINDAAKRSLFTTRMILYFDEEDDLMD